VLAGGVDVAADVEPVLGDVIAGQTAGDFLLGFQRADAALAGVVRGPDAGVRGEPEHVVALVTSGDHVGLVSAIAPVLPGAAWRRCRTHYHRNLLTRVPKSAQPWASTLVRTIFEQPAAASVRAQHGQVVSALEARLPQAAAHLDAARDDILAFTAFPREVWRQVWSNNPQERLSKEVRRRTGVVGIFPNRGSIIRLVGAVLAEQDDEWTESRRYMGPEILAACRKAAAGNKADVTSDAGLTIEAIPA
jgi:putative transposase